MGYLILFHRNEEEFQIQQQQLQHDRDELKADREWCGSPVFHGLLQIKLLHKNKQHQYSHFVLFFRLLLVSSAVVLLWFFRLEAEMQKLQEQQNKIKVEKKRWLIIVATIFVYMF